MRWVPNVHVHVHACDSACVCLHTTGTTLHVYASSVQAIHFDVVHALEHSLVSWHSL